MITMSGCRQLMVLLAVAALRGGDGDGGDGDATEGDDNDGGIEDCVDGHNDYVKERRRKHER